MRSLLPLFVLFALASGCQARVPAAGSAPAPAPASGAATAAPDDVTLPRVTANNSSLLFSWLDERGRMATTASMDEVPGPARARVGVVDLSLTPEQRQANRYAFFADLTTPDASGSFPVVVVSRYNAARGEKLKVALPPTPDGAVIVYSAEWCAFCKKAKKWLAAAKMKSGGVPVIDWEGTLIIGFDQRRLQGLLAARTAGGD